MKLPVSPDVILQELTTAKVILEKWEKILNEVGVPGTDVPGGEDQLDDFSRELCGELRLVGGKCNNLADTIVEGMS